MNSSNNISVQALVIAILLSNPVYADSSDGIVLIKSNNSVTATIDKLETILKSKGMTVFNRIDHAAGVE